MKIVILAAGMGTRLGSVGPKPMTEISKNKSLLDNQVEHFINKYGKDSIMLVVGHKKELVMERYPDLMYVYNEIYPATNTSKSLLKALSKLDEDVIWVNGDVFFEDSVLNLFDDQDSSVSLVDNSKTSDEEVKYTTGGNGYINNISKEVENAQGESLGINLIKKGDIANFKEELANVDNQDYFEKALENLIINNKLNLKPVDIGDKFVKEVDFLEDLEEVKNYLNN